MKIVLRYLTKSGCTLCDKYVFFLRRLKGVYPEVHMEVINIDDDPEYREFLMKVPVVLVNGQVLSSVRFDERAIREHLDKLRM